MSRLEETHLWIAKGLRVAAPLRNDLRLVHALAKIPREQSLGPGLWQLQGQHG